MKRQYKDYPHQCGGAEMKERPILFSGDMVRAILDGRKTMTRRIIKFKSMGNLMEHGIREISGTTVRPRSAHDPSYNIDILLNKRYR